MMWAPPPTCAMGGWWVNSHQPNPSQAISNSLKKLLKIATLPLLFGYKGDLVSNILAIKVKAIGIHSNLREKERREKRGGKERKRQERKEGKKRERDKREKREKKRERRKK